MTAFQMHKDVKHPDKTSLKFHDAKASSFATVAKTTSLAAWAPAASLV